MVTIKIVLGSKPQRGNLYPVRIRFTKERSHKVVGLNMLTFKDDFENEQFKRKAENSKFRNQYLMECKLKASKLLDEFLSKDRPFALSEFVDSYKGGNRGTITIDDFFTEIITELELARKYATAKSYKETKNSVYKFAKKTMTFIQLDNLFLEKYEVYLRSIYNSNGGISVKMRVIRALYNKAIKRKMVDKKYYPFDTYKVSNLKSSVQKRALSVNEFRALKSIDIEKHPNLLDSYHFFLFSFYTRGMNFMDMMLLKHENICNGQVKYVRAKTKGKFTIKLLPEAISILEYYKGNSETGYVFPILLSDNLDAKQINNRRKKTLKKYNGDLKKLALIAGLSGKLTSYVARHSYATLLRNSGVSTDVISQSMGHSSSLVTTAYLRDFGNDVIDSANDALSNL